MITRVSHPAVALAWSITFLLVTGCTSPEQKRQAAAEAIRSWEATLGLTREQLERDIIPRGYARQILEAARDQQRSQQKRPEWRSLPPDTRQDFATALDQLAASLAKGSTPSTR